MNTPLNPDALANLRLLADEGTRELRHVVLEPELLHKLLDIADSAALPEVASVEELEALPIGSVILDADNDAGIVEYDGVIFCETNKLSKAYVFKHYRNLRVLYRPEGN